MEIQKPGRRRQHHPEEFKQAVIEACCEQGASVVGIALANNVNVKQVRRGMRERGIEAPTRRRANSVRQNCRPFCRQEDARMNACLRTRPRQCYLTIALNRLGYPQVCIPVAQNMFLHFPCRGSG